MREYLKCCEKTNQEQCLINLVKNKNKIKRGDLRKLKNKIK